MKLTRWFLFSVILGTGVVKGEETVLWDELAKIVKEAKPDRSREYTVVTKAGEQRKMRQLLVFSQYLQIEPYGSIRREDVSEIQIRHRGRRNYFGWLTDKLCPDPESCVIPPMFLVILPIDLAFGAVATPPMLVVEGSRRRKPARILKIVP